MPELNKLIRECVEEISDPLIEHICTRTAPSGFDYEKTWREVNAMVQRRELRMKRDTIDHDWSYRRGRNWDKTESEDSDEEW